MNASSPSLVARAVVSTIRVYQTLLSRHAKRACPFEPSCSHYAVLAVEKYGARLGLQMGMLRVARCNPFYKGSRVDWP